MKILTLVVALLVSLTACNDKKADTTPAEVTLIQWQTELATAAHTDLAHIQRLSPAKQKDLYRLAHLTELMNESLKKEFCPDMGKGLYENAEIVDADNNNVCK